MWLKLKDSVINYNSVPFQVHYYNETHAVWEPLIERVEGKRQWNLRLDVRKPQNIFMLNGTKGIHLYFLVQWFSRCGLGFWRPFQGVHGIRTIFIMILRRYISFLSSSAHEHTMEFSRDCDIATEWILRQKWESICLLLRQALERFVNAPLFTIKDNFNRYLLLKIVFNI